MARGFSDQLKELREGALLAELPSKLADLVAAVRTTGKKGKLTLTLDVKLLQKNNDHTLLIVDTVTVKMPEPDRESTVLYATESNELTRRDPRQPDLPGVRGAVPMRPQIERTAEQS